MAITRIDIPQIVRLLEEMHALFTEPSESAYDPQPWSRTSLFFGKNYNGDIRLRYMVMGSSVEDLIEKRQYSGHKKLSLTKAYQPLQNDILKIASRPETNTHPEFSTNIEINNKGSAVFTKIQIKNYEIVNKKRSIVNGLKAYHNTCDVIERIFQLTNKKSDADETFWGIRFGKGTPNSHGGGSIRASSAAEAVLMKLLSTHGETITDKLLDSPEKIKEITKDYWVFPISPIHAHTALESSFGMTPSWRDALLA